MWRHEDARRLLCQQGGAEESTGGAGIRYLTGKKNRKEEPMVS